MMIQKCEGCIHEFEVSGDEVCVCPRCGHIQSRLSQHFRRVEKKTAPPVPQPQDSFSIRTCGKCGAWNRIPARKIADTGKCGSCKAPLPPPPVERNVQEAVATEKKVGFWGKLFNPASKPNPVIETPHSVPPANAFKPATSSTVVGKRRLMLSRNETTGFLKDTSGCVRGLWFADKKHASDVLMLKAAIALAEVQEGYDKVEQSDYSACCAGLCTVAPAEGGYLVVFPSAKTAPD